MFLTASEVADVTLKNYYSMTSKQTMIDFIAAFETYPTMNSWNDAYGYSYNMKIHFLPLTSKEKDVLYDALATNEYQHIINDVIEDWNIEMKKYGTHSEKKEIYLDVENLSQRKIAAQRAVYESSGFTYDRHGTKTMTMWKQVDRSIFEAGFNGRNGGHLVLYKWNGHNYTGTGWTHNKAELEDMDVLEIKYVYEVLKSFESLRNRLIRQARWITKHMKVKEEIYSVKKTRQVLVEK